MFLNLIATKQKHFSDEITLKRPLSERINLTEGDDEVMRQLILIKNKLYLFRDIDDLTHLWAIAEGISIITAI